MTTIIQLVQYITIDLSYFTGQIGFFFIIIMVAAFSMAASVSQI